MKFLKLVMSEVSYSLRAVTQFTSGSIMDNHFIGINYFQVFHFIINTIINTKYSSHLGGFDTKEPLHYCHYELTLINHEVFI